MKETSATIHLRDLPKLLTSLIIAVVLLAPFNSFIRVCVRVCVAFLCMFVYVNVNILS